MGSLNASGVISVVAKNSHTFRKRDILITRADSKDDTIVNLVTTAVVRTIGSGSIVRDDNFNPATAEYHEELVFGLQNESRSSSARVARTGLRDLSVPITGSGTLAVIETSLQPDTPQLWSKHTGNRIVLSQSVGDTTVDRILASGAFD